MQRHTDRSDLDLADVEQYVVVGGGDNLGVTGPFGSQDDAREWAQRESSNGATDQPYAFVRLRHPQSPVQLEGRWA